MPRREQRMLICEIGKDEHTGNLSFFVVSHDIYKSVRDCKSAIQQGQAQFPLSHYAIIQVVEIVKVREEIKRTVVAERIPKPAPEPANPDNHLTIQMEDDIKGTPPPVTEFELENTNIPEPQINKITPAKRKGSRKKSPKNEKIQS